MANKKAELNGKIDNLLTELQDRNTSKEYKNMMKKRHSRLFFLITVFIIIIAIVVFLFFILYPEQNTEPTISIIERNLSDILSQLDLKQFYG